MIRVLIADDQPIVRRSLAALIEQHGDIRVVAEAADGRDAVAQARRSRPDVVLMDVRMPGGDGLTATAELAGPAAAHPVPVVVITTFDLDEYVFGALENGAAGFLLKDTAPDELITAIRAAAAGDGLVSPAVTRRVIGEFARRRPVPSPSGPMPSLTGRERDVLAGIAAGRNNSEIAADLFVEIGTVKTHVSHVIAKLGVRDRTTPFTPGPLARRRDHRSRRRRPAHRQRPHARHPHRQLRPHPVGTRLRR
ncbi:response regulator [Brachybacterium hainanense]|uniref:Response regulator n=1 Tax=Brachybacterium hainanense TaxID=1541174 RepID=A0ABV6R9Y6_9MICO